MKDKKRKLISPLVPLKKCLAKIKCIHSSAATKVPYQNEKTWYDLGKVIDWIENTTNSDLRSAPELSSEQVDIRNKKLFPFIKESFV